MYQQVVLPNLNTIGEVGLCEKYTEDAFGVSTARHDADALLGWEQDRGQHPGEVPPSNVSVPIAFDWFGTVDGVFKNWGHRCIWNQGIIYSSPLSGSGHLTYPSIPAIQLAFGLGNYLGFSEFIEDLQVIKQGDTMDDKDITAMYLAAGKSEADATLPANLAYYRGKKPEQLANDLYKGNNSGSPSYFYKASHYDADVAAAAAQATNHDSALAYVNKNLK